METTHTPTPPPGRGARLATVGLLGVISVAGIGASFTERIERSQTDRFQSPAKPSMSFSADNAEVDVDTAPTTEVTLTRTVTWAGPDGPATPQLLPSGELRMRGCDVPWWKRLATYGTCSARYSIVMPNGRSLAATSDTGSVRARGAFDALALRTDVGDIISTGLSARTLRATVDVGEVNAVLTNTPDSVVARADVGSVTLTLPAGQYNIRATTDIGDVNVDASLSNPQSTRTIDVRVDVGDITIRVAR